MSDFSDDEIIKNARDRSLPGYERRKFQAEEKVRGLRNKQKRNNYATYNNLLGGAIIAIAGIGIAYLITNNATVIGIVDDFLLVPLVAWATDGFYLIQT